MDRKGRRGTLHRETEQHLILATQAPTTLASSTALDLYGLQRPREGGDLAVCPRTANAVTLVLDIGTDLQATEAVLELQPPRARR